MSKKSRKRNKKILAALALAGGAAMLAKGRTKGNVSKTAAMEDANIGTNAPILGTDHITKKAVVEPAAVTTGGSGYLSRMGGAGDKATQLANQIKRAEHSKRVSNVLPPSELVSTARPNRFGRIHANTAYRGGGIAKRGSGVALKSGGRVKSMGIAKRGGGAAKR